MNSIFKLMLIALIFYAQVAYAARAIVYFREGPGPQSGKVSGTLKLYQETIDSLIFAEGIITGLSPGLHGFHVHETSNFTVGCDSVGSHFNPFNMNHGGPSSAIRHVGDLGNIAVDQNGVGVIRFSDHMVKIIGPLSVINRSFAIHEKTDDLGLGGNLESTKTGNSGKRIACGRVEEDNYYNYYYHGPNYNYNHNYY